MKKKKKKYKRFYPSEENPRYGQIFQIEAIQIENIDHEFSDWLELTNNELIKVGENWLEWRKTKRQISDIFSNILNNSRIKIPVKNVVSLRIHYLGDKPGDTQIV